MTVKELRNILDTCEYEAEVRIIGCKAIPFTGAGNSIVNVGKIINDSTGTSVVFIGEAED